MSAAARPDEPWRLALAWAALVSAALFALFRDWGFDDPYITYRYAANLAGGAGFVYNPGERVLSTTAPLYAIALAPFAAAGLPLPPVSNLIGCLSLGAGSLALWRLGQLGEQRAAGAVAALLFPLSPFLVQTLGAETVTFIALSLWGLVAAWSDRPLAAAALVAAATLVRADGALAAGLAGLAILARRGWRPALSFGALAALLVGAAALAAWWYFGSPLPATLAAKRSQALIAGSRSYWEGLVERLGALFGDPRLAPLYWLAPLGVVAGAARRSPLALAAAWGLLHGAAYSLIGVTAYFWYYGPALTGLLVAAALGAELAAAWLGRRLGRRVAGGAVALLALLALSAHLTGLGALLARPDQRVALYRAAGEWLAANTSPDARVGALEIGVIGFYGRRPMVDFAGLAQPEVARRFAEGAGYGEAAVFAVERYRPDYLISQEQALPLVGGNPSIQSRCAEVAALPDPRFAEPMRIYRCDWQEGR